MSPSFHGRSSVMLLSRSSSVTSTPRMKSITRSRSALLEAPRSDCVTALLLLVNGVSDPLISVWIVRLEAEMLVNACPASQTRAELSGTPLLSTGTSP